MEKQLDLVIGEKLAAKILKNNAEDLIKKIKKLREKRSIPLVRITDEIKTDKNSYEIKLDNKVIFKKTILSNKNEGLLIEEIVENIDRIYVK